MPTSLFSPPIGDPGFELPALTAASFQYTPNGTPWAFTTGAGVSSNKSPFTSTASDAPEGSQVAILQGSGSISQTIPGFAAGTYQVVVLAAQRGSNNTLHQDFAILIDGAVVATITPAGTTYGTYASSAVPLAAGPHTLTFQGLNTAGGDNTAFLDDVQVVPLVVPTPVTPTPVTPTPAPTPTPITPTVVVGPTGPPGSQWRVGSGAPSNALGVDGDCYLDKLTGNVYQRVGGVYAMQTVIMGPPGNPGNPGAPGVGTPGPAGHGITVTTSATAPVNPSAGDVWIVP